MATRFIPARFENGHERGRPTPRYYIADHAFQFIGNCSYVRLSLLQSNVDGLEQTVEEALGLVPR